MYFSICRGLGQSSSGDTLKSPFEEVNEYLARAIDARSIDRLKAENISRITLRFKDPLIETKVRCQI
jgi:hypothetical protein